MERSKDHVPEAVIQKANPSAYQDQKHTHWERRREPVPHSVRDDKIPILKEKERQSMSQQRKRKVKSKNTRRQHREQTTFDPKLHHRSKGSSGYGLKRDHVETAEETSGAQLAHLFDTK